MDGSGPSNSALFKRVLLLASKHSIYVSLGVRQGRPPPLFTQQPGRHATLGRAVIEFESDMSGSEGRR